MSIIDFSPISNNEYDIVFVNSLVIYFLPYGKSTGINKSGNCVVFFTIRRTTKAEH